MQDRIRRRLARLRVVDRVSRAVGVALIASGLAHYAAPRPFEALSKPFFPESTDTWVRVNGASEAVIGVLLVESRTRVFGLAGAFAYMLYLGDRVVHAAQRWLRPADETSPTSFVD